MGKVVVNRKFRRPKFLKCFIFIIHASQENSFKKVTSQILKEHESMRVLSKKKMNL